MQVYVKHTPSYFKGAVSEPERPMISATLTFPCKKLMVAVKKRLVNLQND